VVVASLGVGLSVGFVISASLCHCNTVGSPKLMKTLYLVSKEYAKD
jgi:hypothetical protein